jgi:hypothetical protein
MSAKAVVSSLILAGAVSTFLLPLATPAVAELGHPSGCFMCSPVDVTAPTQDYYREGGPAIGLELRMGFPPGATALAPETDAAAAPKIRHVRQYHTRRAQLWSRP